MISVRNSIRFQFVLVACTLLVPAVSFAQVPSMEATLAFIQSHLGSDCKLEVVKGDMIAVYYEKGKKAPAREDKVEVDDLDPENSGYEKAEKVFYVPCFGNAGKCVYRKMYKTEIFREYNRISFIIDADEKTVLSLKKAFTHLAKMVHDDNYKANITFE